MAMYNIFIYFHTEWAMDKQKKATMKDVAERAGVSVATVSRVINNEELVSVDVRKTVRAAVEELHYVPKSTTTYSNGRAKRIGLVIPDITNPYFPCLIQGITTAAKVHDVEVVLANSDEDIESERNQVTRLLDSGVDGIIYIPFSDKNEPQFNELIEKGFPVVYLDREAHATNISSVTSNNEEGAYQAVTYLLSLGHRDILFISGPPHLSTSTARLAGYKRGLAEYGLECRKELIIHGDTKQESAYRETRKYIQKDSTSHTASAAFTAIFASNDLMAFGAWKALEQNGYQIPDDISIIGYDDIPFSSFISLTTIAQPGYEIGRNSMLVLVDLITKRRKPPQKILLRDSLVIRRSCKRI
jgi:LacI family transcriptional regulator